MGFYTAWRATHRKGCLRDIQTFPDAQHEGLLLALRQLAQHVN
jgi:hypothetical protein